MQPDLPAAVPSRGLRRFEIVALSATIPAFYLAMLAIDPIATTALYAVALVACLAVLWKERASSDRSMPMRSYLGRRQVSVLLCVGLLACAVAPAGDELDFLLIRLGTSVLAVFRIAESIRPWFWRGDLPRIIALAIFVFGLCGLGFWWLEPQVHSFGDGVWLAFTTAATVGYGDIVPSTPAAKIFAVFVVLLGFAVLSLVTASIAALWVQTGERKMEKEMLHELHRELRLIRREIAEMRAGTAAPPRQPSSQKPSGQRRARPATGETGRR